MRSRLRRASTLAAMALMAFSLPAVATSTDASEDHGFDAHYRLYASGYPNALIRHQLSKDNERVESLMTGRALAVATGNEHSRFLDDGKTLSPLLYVSEYGLIGFQKRYSLPPEDLDGMLDRQMMLYQLSRDARSGHCTQATPCHLRYANHRGSERELRYHQTEPPASVDIAGLSERYPVTLEVMEQGRESPLLMSFHPDQPGLIVEAEMRRDDGREYRLVLRDVVFD